MVDKNYKTLLIKINLINSEKIHKIVSTKQLITMMFEEKKTLKLNRRRFIDSVRRYSGAVLVLPLLDLTACGSESGDPAPQNPTLGTLKLLTPISGQEFFTRNKTNITWEATNVTNIKLEYSYNNGVTWFVIANNIAANLGTFEWTIGGVPSANYLIRISDVTNTSIKAEGTGNFKVTGRLVLNVSDYAELATVGGIKILNDADYLKEYAVQKTGANTFKVLDMTCTHAGCETAWNGSASQFQCPCHGSKFNKDGTVVEGPAASPLASLSVTYNSASNEITIIYN